jgi:hypothetical protein
VYAAILVAVAVALAALPGPVATRLVQDSSTNLVNLRTHPSLVLVLSAFVQPSWEELAIVVPVLWAYGAVQRWLGRAATIVTAVLGHVGATLFVATFVAAGIAKGRINISTAHAADVGASYGLVAVAGLLAARVSRRWLAAYLTGLSGLLLAGLLVGRTFTDLGHVVAWVIGLGLALLVSRARQATGRLARAGGRPEESRSGGQRRATAVGPQREPTSRPGGMV